LHTRLATAADAADISTLICAFSPVAPGTPGAEAFLYGFSVPGILEKIRNPADRVLLACENDQVAGVVSLHGGSKIGLFFVDRRFQGRGVGRILFQRLEALARGAGSSGPWVVNAGRRANLPVAWCCLRADAAREG
jgi:GNAT superfamily N-acetyltransferase